MGDASGVLTVSAHGNSARRLVAGARRELSLRLGRAELHKGPFALMSDIEAKTELHGLDGDARVVASADLEARGSGERYPFALQAQLGPLSELVEAGAVRLEALSTVGANTLSANGRVTGLGAAPSAELELRLSGPRLSGLGADTGGRLMDVGPVSIDAVLNTRPGVYRFSGLKAEVAGSDLSGDAMVVLHGGRPRVSANLRSNVIDLWELLPYRPTEGAAEPVASQASPSLIPDQTLPLAELISVDADVHIAVAKLRTGIDTRIDDVDARVVLSEGHLEAGPVSGEFAGGRTDLRLLLDASEQPARFNLKLQERQMLLGTLVPIVTSSGESVGRVDVDLDVSGVGDTPRAIASSLDGHLALAGEGGAVNRRMLRLLVIGIGDILRPFLNRQGNTHLNCLVFGVGFEKGLGTMRTFLVDMPALLIGGSGTIDLRDETLALRFRTDSKYASLASLTGPFYVTGALGAPRARTSATGTAFAAVTSPLTITHGVLGRFLRGGRNSCEIARAEVQPVLDEPAGSSAAAPDSETTPVVQSGAPRARPSRRR